MRGKGERVGAVLSYRDGKVLFLGYGNNLGDQKIDDPRYPKPVGQLADLVRSSREDATNPLIELDNGGYVWGCECWWGDEGTVKEMLLNYEYEIVNIDEVRSDYRG